MKRFSKLKKIVFGFMLFTFSLFNLGAITFVDYAVPQLNRYVLYIKSCDWGAAVDKIVMNTGKSYTQEQVIPTDFDVESVLIGNGSRNARFGLNSKTWPVSEAYISNEIGERVEGSSKYITLVFPIGPDVKRSDPFSHNIVYAVNDICGFRIENDQFGYNITECEAYVNEEASVFKTSSIISEDVTLQYAYYEQPKKSDKTPLIIWLHGITEGGKNPYLPLFGTKTMNLVDDKIQKYFKHGADVLVPLCPTSWLETTSLDTMGNRVWEPIDIQGMVKKYVDPIMKIVNGITPVPPADREESLEPFAATSYYTEILTDLIEVYLDSHPYIDRKRVYIGGCSAGGYMTINMLIEKPELFAAAFPTCEAYLDSKIKDEDIEKLAKIPMWFVHAQTDKTIKPDSYDAATVRRLRKAGAKNIHYTLYESVIDQTGVYKTEEGEPFEYNGHCSWIYTLNNDPEEDGVSLFEWLSKQKKK